jgi:serine protease AprX
MVSNGLIGQASVILVFLFMLLPAAIPAAQPLPLGEADRGVLDPYLSQILDTTHSGEELEIVVQFEAAVLSEDRRLVDREGLDLLHEYTIIPAMWLRATPLQIDRMTRYDRVTWIEYNEELQWMMDETTNVINATRTWASRIEGSLWGAEGITGRGVTVVVVDSGIDAGHPDLDYGTKTIRNLKSDTGTGPWYEIENGDTSSGHGTHVAGTVAGNGDASAGQRAGVAPGANLIGLSVGEAVFVTGGLGGLEWAYEHSRPGNNPNNIKVVTNSWGGGGGQYNPQDSISQAINNLVYDNNVVVSFAAGNSGGSGNDIQASNYGNTPSAINVAAAGRDGTYITDFSSKGQWDWVDTWPDVAAPGHNIESTAARRTLISLLQRGSDANPYYFAISGTSMATPHVAGLAALIWQAAPSLRVSEVPEDAGLIVIEDGEYKMVEPDEDSYGNLAYNYSAWVEDAPDTRIHEVELIMKLTADYIPPQGEGNPDLNNQTENYVPTWSVPGFAAERSHDFSQGYGLTNALRAVGLALTVERIRWDHPEATVLDAYRVFEDIFEQKEVSALTDRLTTSWTGEWSRFNDQFNKNTFTSNLTKFVLVPEGAEEVTVTMSYRPVDARDLIAGSLGFQIDQDGDGSWDVESGIGPDLDGTRSGTYTVSGTGGHRWMFGIYGIGFKLQRPGQQIQFQEVRMEVDMSVSVKFPSGMGTIVVNETDLHAINGHLKLMPGSADYTAGNVSVLMDVYNISNIQYSPPIEPPLVPDTSTGSLWWLLILLIVIIVAAYWVARFYPETKVGILVLKVSDTSGATRVYHFSKAKGLLVVDMVTRPLRRPKVIKAEVVDEGEGST